MIESGRHNILGVLVNAMDYEAVVKRIIASAVSQERLAVSAIAVHGIMMGLLDAQQKYRLNCLDLVVPDGQPVRWALQWLHHVHLPDRVYGPRLMMAVCAHSARLGIPVFLYGSTDEVLKNLCAQLRQEFSSLSIVGAESSRFRCLSGAEKDQLCEQIRGSGARIVFVGLGCPRQEVWAYEFRDQLSVPIIAVGAAFAFLAGTAPQAPEWMQASGLEWLFRLASEPGRLWRRYLCLNPLFLVSLLVQLAGARFDTSGRQPRTDLLYG
jgi:N-acetylglucosaminyldiphosphoundecaprenol N-acetyl-beta-D-mannosaminyltransferase